MKKTTLIGALMTILLCSSVYALDLNGLLSGLNTENSTSTTQKENTMTATNLDTKAEYDISPDYIYEGVLFDNKFPQKKYTYIKNLDVMILYGNRSLYEEMKSYTPWITKESFDATFSQEDRETRNFSKSMKKTRDSWKHLSNIKRLLNGTENKIGSK